MNLQNITDLTLPTHNKTLLESQEISKKLFTYLAYNKINNTITSNQLNINDCRVFVTLIKEPLYFVNPIVISHSNEMFHLNESCFTLSGKVVETTRFKTITLIAENFKKPVTFGTLDNDLENIETNTILLESATIQRSLDMLDCKTIVDNNILYSRKPEPVKTTKIHRNTRVNIKNTNTNEIKTIKYKLINQYLKLNWKLIKN